METVVLERAKEEKAGGKEAKEAYKKPYISEEKPGPEFVEELLRSQFGESKLVMTCTKCHHCR